MHIGMFSNAYKPIISGVVRSISLYRQALVEAGHFVALFAPEGKDYEDEEPFVFRYPALPLPTGMDYTFPVVVAPQITWLVPRLKLDIIHTHHPFIVGSEAVNFSRSLGVPLVFTFHTMYHEYAHYLGFDAPIVKQIVRRVIGDYAQKADRIIAPSVQVRDLLPSYNVDCPVDILPTPVDLSMFTGRQRLVMASEDEIRLIYVGRVAKEKNLRFLLRAFAHAVHEEPRLRLRIVGDGPDFEKLQGYALELGVMRQVKFAGAVPYEQVPRQLQNADLFVFASTTETQGLVILEAMAAELPLVLVNSAPLLEVTRPGLDCLVAEQVEADFASAILGLVRDADKARAMGQSGRARASEFGVPSLTSRLLDIYQDTIDAYKRRGHQR